MKTYLKGWHSKWFYIANPSPSLPSYIGHRPVVKEPWSSLPEREEMKQAVLLLEKLATYKSEEGFNGISIVRSFLGRRIQPIKERVHPVYEYEGVQDATRESPDRWTKEEMFDWLKSLFQNVGDIKTAPHLGGFHVNNPPDEVCPPSTNLVPSVSPSEPHSAHCFCTDFA